MINWNNFDSYIFDLDDTLINTTQAVQSGWEYALNKHSFRNDLSQEKKINLLKKLIKFFGSSSDNEYWHAFIFELSKTSIRYPNPIATALCETYRQGYWQELKVSSQILSFLQFLSLKKKPLILVTNGCLSFQIKKLQHTGLSTYFENSVFCSSQYQPDHQKPSPHMLIQVKMKYCVQKSIFIGNANSDIIAGNLAGMDTVLISENTQEQDLKLMEPTYTLCWNEILMSMKDK
ncbi:MAG: HAD family hydrolase [SAR324 cluster bacterium]|nr:HAD family hydrolase [SAR324 cluster bacterium]